MVSTAAHPVHASVAFLRIPQFESRPVAEQAALKERLEQRIRQSIVSISADQRVVLDADDGFALVFFGEPEWALDATLAVRAASSAPLQLGLDYGPLALTARGPDARVFGDGVAEAASAARFAAPEGGILVTQGFRKALAAASPDRVTELVPAGEFTDSRVRMHAFFTPDAERRRLRQRRLALGAAGGCAVILLLGVVGRDIYQPLLRARPAIVKLEIKPRGEVFVDGVSRGRSPPLAEIRLEPGMRRVQIRNPGMRPYDQVLDIRPGQRMTIVHTFVRVEPQKPDFWRDLKRKFGS